MNKNDQMLRALFQRPATPPDYVNGCVEAACLRLPEAPASSGAPRRSVRHVKAAALAAGICLLLLGSGLAAGIARVEMDIGDTGEIELLYAEGSRPSYTGAWEITALPDGFRQTNSAITNSSAMEYTFHAEYTLENDPAERLCLWVDTTDGAHMGYDFKAVSVNGLEGVLYYDALLGVESSLVWTDPARGLVFSLEYCGGQKLDLTAIGESVAECTYVPSREETEALRAAQALLGDYTLPVPPAGYELTLSQSSGSGEDAVVRNVWVGPLGKTVTLEYVILEDPGVSIRDHVVNLKNSLTMDGREFLTVSGMDGCCKTFAPDGRYPDAVTLVWLDREAGLAFTLWAQSLSKEDVIALAESVCLRADS